LRLQPVASACWTNTQLPPEPFPQRPGQVEPAKRLHTTSIIWKSTALFLARLFGSSDFASEGPTFLNRHWILHGRRAADWSIADAVRLLNALSTLDWLMKFADRPATEAGT